MNRSNRAGRLGIVVVAAVAAIALVGPASAFAQTLEPTDVEYEPPVLQVDASGDPADPGETVSASSAGSLPFTGLDLAAFAAIGVGLLATGFVIRRAARTHRQL